ncbi:MAG: phosphoribosylanthranilate isomerase [Candidatus Omnitrophica bacterium]|nr:phosphoribosylanthranilate isomerase [Candidatus Omnitrophota bacterium]
MVKVKICGITNLEDAQAAVRAGADALGFVFYQDSPRHIFPFRAKQIIKKLPKRIVKVGVFVNAGWDLIYQTAEFCSLDMLQLHGSESPEFCRRFKNYRVIKAFRIKDKIPLRKILKFKTYAYLFDTFKRSKPGGTGTSFNWSLLAELKDAKAKIILSGGLNQRNVARAIRQVRPDWVDLSSSVESRPGKKDPQKLKNFIRVTKRIVL